MILSVVVNARPQCETDPDCSIEKTCFLGTCVPACALVSCGLNAICESSFHTGRCNCLPGFSGDPLIACSKGKLLLSDIEISMSFIISLEPPSPPPITSGCASNSDCPDYTACEARKCINPCAKPNICAPNANCFVTRHKAVCTCPDGFIGSPEISCSLRKYIIQV